MHWYVSLSCPLINSLDKINECLLGTHNCPEMVDCIDTDEGIPPLLCFLFTLQDTSAAPALLDLSKKRIHVFVWLPIPHWFPHFSAVYLKQEKPVYKESAKTEPINDAPPIRIYSSFSILLNSSS